MMWYSLLFRLKDQIFQQRLVSLIRLNGFQNFV